MKKLFLCLLLLSSNVFAWQPEHPVKLYVGVPPGGPTDNVARVITEGFAKRGISVVIFNKPGASGAVSASEVAKLPADGYNLLLLQTSVMFAELIKSPAADYKILTSFEHLVPIGSYDAFLYANPKTVEGGIEQVIEDTRTGRKNYSWALTNLGAALVVKQIEDRIGKPINSVVYPGRAPAMNDLLGGHVDIFMDAGVSPLVQFEKEGRVKFLATGNKRNSKEPTLDQALSGIRTHSWSGVSMPAGGNPEIVKYYQKTLKEILNDAESQDKLKSYGVKQILNESFSDLIAEEIKRYKPTADKYYP